MFTGGGNSGGFDIAAGVSAAGCCVTTAMPEVGTLGGPEITNPASLDATYTNGDDQHC